MYCFQRPCASRACNRNAGEQRHFAMLYDARAPTTDKFLTSKMGPDFHFKCYCNQCIQQLPIREPQDAMDDTLMQASLPAMFRHQRAHRILNHFLERFLSDDCILNDPDKMVVNALLSATSKLSDDPEDGGLLWLSWLLTTITCDDQRRRMLASRLVFLISVLSIRWSFG